MRIQWVSNWISSSLFLLMSLDLPFILVFFFREREVEKCWFPHINFILRPYTPNYDIKVLKTVQGRINLRVSLKFSIRVWVCTCVFLFPKGRHKTTGGGRSNKIENMMKQKKIWKQRNVHMEQNRYINNFRLQNKRKKLCVRKFNRVQTKQRLYSGRDRLLIYKPLLPLHAVHTYTQSVWYRHRNIMRMH